MSPIFLMLSGIVVLSILPTLMSPGVANEQELNNVKHMDKMLARHKLTSKQLDWVVDRCVDYKLRATDLVLLVISILNVSVLLCILGIQDELLTRFTQFVGDAPPSYEEAMRGQPIAQRRAT